MRNNNKPIYRTCKDCHIIISKWKSYCKKCMCKHRQIWQRAYLKRHPEILAKKHVYDAKLSHEWYMKQRKMKEMMLDDMIKHPRKYLDRVKI